MLTLANSTSVSKRLQGLYSSMTSSMKLPHKPTLRIQQSTSHSQEVTGSIDDDVSGDYNKEIYVHEPADSESFIVATSGYKVTPRPKEYLTVPHPLLTAGESISYSTSQKPSHLPTLSQSESYCISEDSEPEVIETAPSLSDQILDRFILQKPAFNQPVHFDRASYTESNGKIIAVSSKALGPGKHEWTMEIAHCDVDTLEIGVCGVNEIDDISIDDGGVSQTNALGARGVYGSELLSDSIWYGSYNSNGLQRCFKDLKDQHHIGWTAKDQIKVVVDLNLWRIKFYQNGRKVRKVLSLQSRRKYYPFVSFAGNCQFQLC